MTFIAALAAIALCGCGGSDDPHVLRLLSGQQITASADVSVNLQPQGVLPGHEPACTEWMAIVEIESTPVPLPDYLIPISASVFSGAQLLWSGPFDPTRTLRDPSTGELTAFASGCIDPQFNFALQGQPLVTRLRFDLNENIVEVTAPEVPLEFFH